MKLIKRASIAAGLAAIILTGAAPLSWAGAEHYEFPLTLLDYNDCTEELVEWNAIIKEVFIAHETPSGQGLFRDKWLWEGTVEGLDSGYLWSSKGIASVVENYALENSLTGGFLLVENSVLKPITPDAPAIKLDVKIRTAFNANGDLVVDRVTYTYDCR